MKIMIRLSMCFFLLILFIPAPLAFAKGSPDKITITSPGLASPIEITDPEILNQFNPYDGQFLEKDRRYVTGTSQVDALYEVLFYYRDTGGEFRMFYAFYYSPDPSGMQGHVYLPQEKEEWNVMNNQTIARREGWLYASAEWDSLMTHLLKDQQASPPRFVSAVVTQIIEGSALVIILIVSTVTLWLLWRRRKTPA